ncbi:MAG: tRNA pseudouridine(38-40) synthase TruA [Cyclobacteriaceae bacterium]|nr:tRNA pseudouridine(38-40) synthase TruA [Cyclobacteriaceae bacterium]
MRVFVYIAYKGTNFHGWQIQENAISVQQVITDSLHVLLKNENVAIVGSGRTDTGVHAKEQVFHVDIPDETKLDKLKYQLNGILPETIVVNKITEVISEAHARFDAVSRSYEYHLLTQKSPFGREENYYCPILLDFAVMNKAAAFLLGTHDFQSFSKVKTEVNNFVCTVTRAEWNITANKAVFHITANRFLRGMVRAIVGTLLMVGEGKIAPEEVKKILDKKNRGEAGRAVPPQGLYLCKVEYPEKIIKPHE